jgi:hypothetical protein
MLPAQVAINTTATKPVASAMLDITSTNRGLLIPRMTQAQRNAIVSPAKSLLVYQLDVNTGYYFNAGDGASPSWTRLGHLQLPYSDTLSFAGSLIKITNNLPNAGYGIHSISGKIGIWGETTSNTQYSTGVKGSAGSASVGVTGKYGVLGESDSGIGVVGESDDSYGILGISKNNWGIIGQGQSGGLYGFGWSTGSIAVFGHQTATTGISTGVTGQTLAPEGNGVFGINLANSGTSIGVRGASINSPLGTGVFGGGLKYGVQGIADATSGETFGVYGNAASPSGFGVYGTSFYTGVKGVATSNTNLAIGVYGLTSSPDGFGLYGTSNSLSGYGGGVYGITGSTAGVGVFGINSSFSGNTIGVRGSSASATGYSGYFEGNRFYVSGNVGIGNKSPAFKLDVTGNRIRLINEAEWIAMRTDGNPGFLDLSFAGGSLVMQGTNQGEDIIINPAINKVGIHTWTPQYDLDVNGNIRATGSVFYGGSTSGSGTPYNKPDFVFDDSYKAWSTDEVAAFLQQEKHLPWVTSARQEQKENGAATNMTRMAFETVETIENLQLQLIQLQKLVKQLQVEILELKPLPQNGKQSETFHQ